MFWLVANSGWRDSKFHYTEEGEVVLGIVYHGSWSQDHMGLHTFPDSWFAKRVPQTRGQPVVNPWSVASPKWDGCCASQEITRQRDEPGKERLEIGKVSRLRRPQSAAPENAPGDDPS